MILALHHIYKQNRIPISPNVFEIFNTCDQNSEISSKFKTFISCPILSERSSAVYQNLGWPFSNNINLFSDSPIAGTVLKLY